PDIGPLLAAHYSACPGCVAYFGVSPLLLGFLAAFVAARAPASKPVALPAPPPLSTIRSETGALRLLSILQREARLLDFIGEDIDQYDDSQVGAAARSIHSGCRKAFEGRV